MKFETPIMNISMFEVENVVTTASGTKTDAEKLNEVKGSVSTALTNAGASAENIIGFTF